MQIPTELQVYTKCSRHETLEGLWKSAGSLRAGWPCFVLLQWPVMLAQCSTISDEALCWSHWRLKQARARATQEWQQLIHCVYIVMLKHAGVGGSIVRIPCESEYFGRHLVIWQTENNTNSGNLLPWATFAELTRDPVGDTGHMRGV